MDLSKYQRIPYAALQSNFTGCDCYGLVCLIYRTERGLEPPQIGYKARRAGFALEGQPGAAWERVDAPEAFDVVGFHSGQDMTHCGVMLDATNFLHIFEGGTPSVARVSDGRFRSRLAGFWRLRPKKDESNG